MQIFDFLAGLRSKVTSCGTPKTTPNLIKILRANSECHAPHLMLEAADEIELLRIGVAEALRERDEANATIGTLRADFLKLLELTERLTEVTRRRDTFSDDYITATQDIIALIQKNVT